jgi:hypothetical protein
MLLEDRKRGPRMERVLEELPEATKSRRGKRDLLF